MLTIEETKIWRKEQKKKIKISKKRKPQLWNNKITRRERKIEKYGIYPLRGKLSGSFESNFK